MKPMIKLIENRRTLYLFPLETSNKNVFGLNVAYLDASTAMRGANRRDKDLGYGYEAGPHFSIERQRAMEYVDYVANHATAENVHQFNIPARGYVFFVDSQNRTGTQDRKDS